MSLVESTTEIVKILEGLFEQWNEQKEKGSSFRAIGAERIHSSLAPWKLNNQMLILKEFDIAQKYLADGLWDSLYIHAQPDVTCRCKFYRFNQMPCSHILGRHIASNGEFISEEYWNVLKQRFQ